VISTRADLFARTAITRHYDIHDLLETRWHATRKERAKLAEAIMRLITDTVDNENWGDGGGRIHISHDRLWVKQTPENHRQIVNLLQQLRVNYRVEPPTRNSEPFEDE